MKESVPLLRSALGQTIRRVRQAKNLTQEDFGLVSSRTYLSVLERSLNTPTIDKLVEIAGVMQIHPVALLLVAYAQMDSSDSGTAIIDQISDQAKDLLVAIS